MTTGTRRVSFCQILETYPLTNINEHSESDVEILTKCVKIFKNLDTAQDNTFNFLESKDLHLITQFFAVYGDDIRETEFYECEKLDGEHCVCFLKKIAEKDAHLIKKVLKVVQVKSCTHCQSHNRSSYIQKILAQSFK